MGRYPTDSSDPQLGDDNNVPMANQETSYYEQGEAMYSSIDNGTYTSYTTLPVDNGYDGGQQYPQTYRGYRHQPNPHHQSMGNPMDYSGYGPIPVQPTPPQRTSPDLGIYQIYGAAPPGYRGHDSFPGYNSMSARSTSPQPQPLSPFPGPDQSYSTSTAAPASHGGFSGYGPMHSQPAYPQLQHFVPGQHPSNGPAPPAPMNHDDSLGSGTNAPPMPQGQGAMLAAAAAAAAAATSQYDQQAQALGILAAQIDLLLLDVAALRAENADLQQPPASAKGKERATATGPPAGVLAGVDLDALTGECARLQAQLRGAAHRLRGGHAYANDDDSGIGIGIGIGIGQLASPSPAAADDGVPIDPRLFTMFTHGVGGRASSAETDRDAEGEEIAEDEEQAVVAMNDPTSPSSGSAWETSGMDVDN